MRYLGYMLKASLFVMLQLLLGRFLGSWIGPACALLGTFAISCAVAQHAAVDCALDVLNERREIILDGFIGTIVIAAMASPIWAPLALLWYQHPLLSIAAFLILTFLDALWIMSCSGSNGSNPPASDDTRTGPKPETEKSGSAALAEAGCELAASAGGRP
jgi:hypothetical protein